jgi:hypothetical protein
VASIDKRRIEALEAAYASSEPEDPAREFRRRFMSAITEEAGRLRGCRANSGYRGGKPPTPIQPTDPAGASLGYPYTHGELVEFAVRRVVEREDLGEDLVEKGVGLMRQAYEHMGRPERWDEVEAEGPPEPTPPWR